MPAMINYGSEMIRINPAKNQLEYSTNQGRTWSLRYNGSSAGNFLDLLFYGSELMAVTNKGLFYSTNQGRTWSLRYNGSSAGNFITLMDGGTELLAQTDKGLYYSTNSGRTWSLRHR